MAKRDKDFGKDFVEPWRLKQWRPPRSAPEARFFTCARPGRSYGKQNIVADSIVDKWVEGLPGLHGTVIVSLLGRKQNGKSEFSFYSFHGGWDGLGDRRHKPLSFQQWLNQRHNERSLEVIEYPTVDAPDVPPETLERIEFEISRLLLAGRTVVLVDSGGMERTGAVCECMKFKPLA